jgi:hypothetical protein
MGQENYRLHNPPLPEKIDFQFKIGLIHATDGFS